MGGQLSGGFSGLPSVEAEVLVPDHACSTQDWAKPGPYDQPLRTPFSAAVEREARARPCGGGPAAAGGVPTATESPEAGRT